MVSNINTSNGYVKLKPSENNDLTALRVRYDENSDASYIPTLDVICVEYQDGMENWNIPYFEGMQSVKMPGVTISNEDDTKSITLSTPSDLTLRKVGEVQDEMNVMTGEVVERVKEITFNSSNGWALNNTTFNSVYEFRYSIKEKGVDFIVKSNNFIQGGKGDYERINIWRVFK